MEKAVGDRRGQVIAKDGDDGSMMTHDIWLLLTQAWGKMRRQTKQSAAIDKIVREPSRQILW